MWEWIADLASTALGLEEDEELEEEPTIYARLRHAVVRVTPAEHRRVYVVDVERVAQELHQVDADEDDVVLYAEDRDQLRELLEAYMLEGTEDRDNRIELRWRS